MKQKLKSPLDNLRAYRESLGETQAQFWGRFGITQSGGSRYEAGKRVPVPTAVLILLYANSYIGDSYLHRLIGLASR